MKIFLPILAVCSIALCSQVCLAQDDSHLAVVKYSWSKYHEALLTEPEWNAPPDYRQRTDREKAVAQIQYGDIMKSQALKKAERDAKRSAASKNEIFAYKVKLKNIGLKAIKNLYWEYQVIEVANPDNVSVRQFFCATGIKVNQQRTLEVYSLIPPTTPVISASTLGNENDQAFTERAVVNRIEYKDGSTWQRPGWSFGSPLAEALSTRKLELGEPPCRNY